MRKTCVVAVWLSAGWALADSPLFNAKAYVGTDGARAVVAMVKPAADAKCVLFVTGTLASVDSLVVPCTMAPAIQNRIDYFYTRQGRQQMAAQGFADGSLHVFAPRDVIYKLKYSDAESQKVKLDELWAKQQTQKAELSALARFDRAAEVAAQHKYVQAQLAKTNQQCGTQLTASMDSSKLSEEEFKRSDYSTYCTATLDHLATMCGYWKVARRTFQQKLKEVQCRAGTATELKLSLNGQTLLIEPTPGSGDARSALDKFLKESL